MGKIKDLQASIAYHVNDCMNDGMSSYDAIHSAAMKFNIKPGAASDAYEAIFETWPDEDTE